MADSLAVWRELKIARAYGLSDQGEVINGEYLQRTQAGLASPSFYQGDPAFLQWLGGQLMALPGQLSRLTLSQLLATLDGRYSLATPAGRVLLASWEPGPACDPHNNFELFTVLAGVAHLHQRTERPDAAIASQWTGKLNQLRNELQTVQPPNLHKRALSYWHNLLDTWRVCLEEAQVLLSRAASARLSTSLVLGLQSFSDFVYLADVHMVHYNPVGRCHWDSPMVDLAMLLLSSEGDHRLAESMLLSYEKVRPLSAAEKQLALALLWYPREISLTELQTPDLNILNIRRLQGLLELKIGLISELEELLLPKPMEPDTPVRVRTPPDTETVASAADATIPFADLAGIASPVTSLADQELVEEVSSVETEKLTMDAEARQEEVSSADALSNDAESADAAGAEAEERLEPEEERQQPEVRPNKRVMIWKPFPRALNAPPEPERPVDPPVVQDAPESDPSVD